MSKIKNKKLINKGRRKSRIRSILSGTLEKPRLSVYRSNTNIYLQIINDQEGVTLASMSLKEIKNIEKSKDSSEKYYKEIELGKMIAKKALDKKIKKIVFDRGGYKYHGRVAAIAEGARLGGLKF